MKFLPLLVLSLAPLVPHAQDEIDPATLKALMARCGMEVDWAADWNDAAERSRATGRPVLVVFRTLAGFDLPDSAMTGPFMDRAILDLVEERFVGLRFDKSASAPFKSQSSYGLGPFAFGTSILIATADGGIVGDTFTMESSSLYDFLANEAAEHGVAASPPDELDATARAAWHLRRGEHAPAEKLLAQAETAEGLQLLAELRVRQRRGQEALATLNAAREAGAPKEDVALAEAAVLLRLGRLEACEATLDRIPADHADANAAIYYRASLHLVREEVEESVDAATELVLEHPESREASLAAVYLSLGPLLEHAAGRYPSWPSADVLASLELSPWESAERVPAMRSAQAFLLETQRANGSWVTPGEVMSGQTATFVDSETLGNEYTNPIGIATTALCARALLASREEKEVADALVRAFAFLREARRINEKEGDPFGVMDYSVWSKPTLLLLLNDALATGVVEAEEWKPVMQALVDELAAKQKSGGGWSYYQGNDLENLDPNFDISFSFVTAYVVLGLRAAREAGLDVPEEMADAALGCIERMRNDDGSFEYSLYHANESARGAPMPAGAAGREPLCALALFAWERTDAGEVIEALEAFLRHRTSYAKEKGKSVMHGGPEGQGSHYLMFDYAWAAEACVALGEADREPFVGAVRDQVLDARLASGGFLDNPLLGDRFGAAMGLWALQRLSGSSGAD